MLQPAGAAGAVGQDSRPDYRPPLPDPLEVWEVDSGDFFKADKAAVLN
jgi:hypothetical protein